MEEQEWFCSESAKKTPGKIPGSSRFKTDADYQ